MSNRILVIAIAASLVVPVPLSIRSVSYAGPEIREFISPNPQLGGFFGKAVAGVPDVDGDGLGDVVIGAFQETAGDEVLYAGKVYVFSGGSGNLLRTLESPSPEYLGIFGIVVSGLPDIDGDDRGDIFVSADLEEGEGNVEDVGHAYIFSGSSGALLRKLSSPSPISGGNFGFDVTWVPDITGDQIIELIVGTPYEADGESPPHSGRVHLFDGSTFELIRTLTSPNEVEEGRFGSSVAGLSDINGDGLGEILVGAPREFNPFTGETDGRVYVIDGSTGEAIHEIVSPNAEDDNIRGFFGLQVASVDDLNSDGRQDFLASSITDSPGSSPHDAGRVYVFDGVSGTLIHTLRSPNEEYMGLFGEFISGIPDVTGDGFGDIIVGTGQEDPGNSPPGAGRAYIFDGIKGILIQTLRSPHEITPGNFGIDVAGVPDANGDGLGEVIVGAWGETSLPGVIETGRAYLFYSPFNGADLNRDGSVDFLDLTSFTRQWMQSEIQVK
jgi:hypothetical protein